MRHVVARIDDGFSALKSANHKLRAEDGRLAKENVALAGMKEMFTMRLENEEKVHVRRKGVLEKQLEEERNRR